MKRYDVWCRDEYLGIFWEDEVRWLSKAGKPIITFCLDD
jgi:hypothetical protein